MALTTKSELSEYCLRKLGKPVVDINVDIDQISDRIDDALEYFNQFHYDGIERLYLSHTITQADLDRVVGVNSETATEDSVSSVWTNQNNWIPIPDSVVSIVNVYHPSTAFGSNWYNQAAMIGTGLLKLSSNDSLVSMEMFKTKLDLLDSIFNARSSLRFNHLSSKLYFDGDWDETFNVGDAIHQIAMTYDHKNRPYIATLMDNGSIRLYWSATGSSVALYNGGVVSDAADSSKPISMTRSADGKQIALSYHTSTGADIKAVVIYNDGSSN